MPVKQRSPNRDPWTAAEHEIILRANLTESQIVKALKTELGITRSRSSVGIERRTLARIKGAE